MSDSIYYRVPDPGEEWPDHFPSGTYEDEDRLIALLQIFSQHHGLPPSLSVHIYKTDGTPLGIGRKHVGAISASSVLMAGTIDLSRL